MAGETGRIIIHRGLCGSSLKVNRKIFVDFFSVLMVRMIKSTERYNVLQISLDALCSFLRFVFQNQCHGIAIAYIILSWLAIFTAR